MIVLRPILGIDHPVLRQTYNLKSKLRPFFLNSHLVVKWTQITAFNNVEIFKSRIQVFIWAVLSRRTGIILFLDAEVAYQTTFKTSHLFIFYLLQQFSRLGAETNKPVQEMCTFLCSNVQDDITFSLNN